MSERTNESAPGNPAVGNRLFLCLRPDTETAGFLADKCKSLHHRPWSGAVRWVKPEHWHVTLAFFPEVTEEAETALKRETAAALENTPAFEIELESISIFPRISRPRALAAVFPGNEGLKRLRAAVQSARRAAGVAVDDTLSFRPHITLGRIKPGAPRIHSLPVRFPPGQWKVDSAELWKSELTGQGPVYETRETWSLRAPGVKKEA